MLEQLDFIFPLFHQYQLHHFGSKEQPIKRIANHIDLLTFDSTLMDNPLKLMGCNGRHSCEDMSK